jgi:serine/threonine-protein kinase RsbT
VHPSITREQSLPLQSDGDVVKARQLVREWSVDLKFNLVEQTKLITAASELARNTIIYGGGGTLRLEGLNNGVRTGLRLTFEDQGPGIADIELAMQDGYTTGSGLGLGLGGAKRLVSEFEIHSEAGKGTRVTVTRWK